MKNFTALILLVFISVSTQARTRSAKVSLSECNSRTLLIEMNVGENTPKSQMIEAINTFSEFNNFSVTPARSESSEVAFRAKLQDTCVSDSCAKELGWFDLQKRFGHFKGVAISCELPKSAGAHAPSAPRAPAPAPGGGSGDPNQPPIPGAGGVTGGNVSAGISAD